MPLELPSFAKINWILRILGKRDDGFHEIFTVFQTVSLHDTLRFEESDDLTLTCTEPIIPTDERNLILRAAIELRRLSGSRAGARIHLEKRIPSPGGLGGGSSNAATTLLALCRLWQVNPAEQDLRRVAAGLGSDVPYFLFGGTSIGTGRGETVEPTKEIEAKYLIIVTPNVAVSTTEAYAATGSGNLTKAESDRILFVCRSQVNDLYRWPPVLINDFEESLIRVFPEIKRAKERILELGAAAVSVSGSGASIFAVFDKQETRQTALKALGDEPTWRVFAVSTVSRDEYRDALFAG